MGGREEASRKKQGDKNGVTLPGFVTSSFAFVPFVFASLRFR